MNKKSAIVMSAIVALNGVASAVSFAETKTEGGSQPVCPNFQDNLNAKFDIAQIINPIKITANSKEEALAKLPKKITIKIKKHDCTKPIYREGIYRKSIIRYVIKDTEGNIIKEPVSFSAKAGENCKCETYSSTSKEGYLDFKTEGKNDVKNIEINSDKYELAGKYSFKEIIDEDGFYTGSVDKDGNELSMSKFIPDNGTTYKIPDAERENFVIVLKNKKAVEKQTPEISDKEKSSEKESDTNKTEPTKDESTSTENIQQENNKENQPAEDGGSTEKQNNPEKNKNISTGETKTSEQNSDSHEGSQQYGQDSERILIPGAKESLNPQDIAYATDNIVRYVIKDTKGNKIMKDKMKFHLSHNSAGIYSRDYESEPGADTQEFLSKSGFVEFRPTSVENRNIITLEDNEYRLIGYNAFEEHYHKEYLGNIIDKVIYGRSEEFNNGKKINKYDENGFAFIPEEFLTLTVERKKTASTREKVEIENPQKVNIAYNGMGIHKMGRMNFLNLMVKRSVRNPEKINAGASEVKEKTEAGNEKTENIEVEVKWSINKKKTTEKNIVFEGKLNMPNGVINPDELTARVSVEIHPERVGDEQIHVSKNLPRHSSHSSSRSSKNEKNIQIVAGNNRENTSVELSKKHYSKAETAIIVNGYNYADALVASSLSSVLNAPILLSSKTAVSNGVKDELKRLEVKNIIVIGGENSVSSSALKSLGSYKIERISGNSRYETAEKVFDKLKSAGTTSKEAVLASGEGFADALSAGTIAGSNSAPILLTKSKSISSGTKDRIKTENIEKVIVVGGENSISNAVANSIGKKFERLSGSDRYQTSMKVAKYRFPNADKIISASGEGFADALAVGGITGKIDSPIILTTRYKVPVSVKNYVDGINNIEVVGGNNTIDTSQFK